VEGAWFSAADKPVQEHGGAACTPLPMARWSSAGVAVPEPLPGASNNLSSTVCAINNNGQAMPGRCFKR